MGDAIIPNKTVTFRYYQNCHYVIIIIKITNAYIELP